jgi:hypothetical protein
MTWKNSSMCKNMIINMKPDGRCCLRKINKFVQTFIQFLIKIDWFLDRMKMIVSILEVVHERYFNVYSVFIWSHLPGIKWSVKWFWGIEMSHFIKRNN